MIGGVLYNHKGVVVVFASPQNTLYWRRMRMPSRWLWCLFVVVVLCQLAKPKQCKCACLFLLSHTPNSLSKTQMSIGSICLGIEQGREQVFSFHVGEHCIVWYLWEKRERESTKVKELIVVFIVCLSMWDTNHWGKSVRHLVECSFESCAVMFGYKKTGSLAKGTKDFLIN